MHSYLIEAIKVCTFQIKILIFCAVWCNFHVDSLLRSKEKKECY